MSELIEILNDTAKNIIKALPAGVESGAFDANVLRLLSEAESQGQKRQPVLAELAKAMDVLANKPPVDDSKDDAADKTEQKAPADKANKPPVKQGGKAERGEIPEWKKPDYSGSLSCEQAVWRNENLKLTTK